MYANSFNGEFIFDDNHAIVNNADVDASKTPFSNLFKDNFWGYPMDAPNAEHQVRCHQ